MMLESEIVNYQYCVGLGDVFNVIVWDYLEFIMLVGQYCSFSDIGNWVQFDGIMFYLYIGKVYVVGKMFVEICSDIIGCLVMYIVDLQVDVNIVVFCS